jgi:hypothetical protein
MNFARQFRSLCDCGARRRPPGSRCGCLPVQNTPIETPDLAIYSQAEQLANGTIPSWDSPDIVTNEWRPFRLLPEAQVKVRNLSSTTTAANAIVHYSTAPFGIGTRRQLRLTRVVTLGPLEEVTLLFPLSQELLSGDPRTGVFIEIEHPTDTKLLNNSGAQVHDGGYTSESGRTFTVDIPVLNDSGVPRRIDVAVLPTDLSATLTPSSHVFGAFEQIIARLTIAVPAFLSGSSGSPINRAVTVVGRLNPTGEVVGGATRLLRIDT